MATRSFASAAQQAAAMPAGPSPTTSTSNSVRSPTDGDLHAFAAAQLASVHVLAAIYRYATFKTDSHAAERASQLAGHGAPQSGAACHQDSRGNRRAAGNANRNAVNGHLHEIRHGQFP